MRVLCVCRSGHVRSVATARLVGHVERGGHEAVAVGLKQPSALPVLCEWAERIYAADELVAATLHRMGWGAKVDMRYAVGPDDWKQPDHPDLFRRLRDLVEANPPT